MCPEHRAAWLATRYHAPEAPGEVFTCIVPGCDTPTPHREFHCERHWGMVGKKRRWQIKHYAELYRVLLGLAIEEVLAKEQAERDASAREGEAATV
jgi:hypothetical protein